MEHRAALYVDFDNVFGSLLKADPSAAAAFAERPQEWVERLTEQHLVGGSRRRWLVRRCYLNPAGSVIDPRRDQARLNFAKFRPYFVRAGFEVIDCPTLTNRGKNAADMRMALDGMDALTSAPVDYDEFVIASGDSDFTPLLTRLRAADRRVTVMLSSDAAAGYLAIADRAIRVEETIALLTNKPDEVVVREPVAVEPTEALTTAQVKAAYDAFRERVRSVYDAARSPLVLSTLAHQVRDDLGPVVAQSKWFGHGSFSGAIDSVGLVHAQRSPQHLWDQTRHETPSSAQPRVGVPPAVEQLCLLLDVPRLTASQWSKVFDALAASAADPGSTDPVASSTPPSGCSAPRARTSAATWSASSSAGVGSAARPSTSTPHPPASSSRQRSPAT